MPSKRLAFRPAGVDVAGVILFAAIGAALAYRLTRSIDLSDEAYYASFVVTWLRDGLARNPFLAIHQTAALLVLPAAAVFRAVTGSTDGIMLFLRALYLSGSVVTGLATVAFMRRVMPASVAWAAGCMVVAFVPFGLPAPSYNTIGGGALIIACCCFGSAVLTTTAARRGWLVASAIAWTTAIVAYPSLTIVFIACAAGVISMLSERRTEHARFFVLVALLSAAAFLTVAGVLGIDHARETIAFDVADRFSPAATSKFSAFLHPFVTDPWFAVICVAATAVAVMRRRLGPVGVPVAQAIVVVALFGVPPALFTRSHDIVLVIALSGLGLIAHLRPSAPLTDRVIALLYVVALFAGAVTSASTAANGFYNFPVGGLFAAVLATVQTAGAAARAGRQRLLATGTTAAALLYVSCTSFYHEWRPGEAAAAPALVVRDGAFAGITASPEQLALIEAAGRAFAALRVPGASVTILGRMPGLYLLTPATPRTPYPTTSSDGPGMRRYYADERRRPAFVVVYSDRYVPTGNPFGPSFERWYAPMASYETPPGTLELYRARR